MKFLPVMTARLAKYGTLRIPAGVYLGRIEAGLAQDLADRGTVEILSKEELQALREG